MKLSSFLFVFLISVVFAQKEEVETQNYTPQGHLEYSDPDGYKVSWKLYAPFASQQFVSTAVDTNVPESQTQIQTQSQRVPRAEAKAPYYNERYVKLIKKPFDDEEEQEVEKKPAEQYNYQPYSKIPAHIKKLMEHMYDSRPYVDPSAFVYQFRDQNEQKPLNEGSSNTEGVTESPNYRDFDSGTTYKQYQTKYYGSPSGKSMKSGNYRYKGNYNKELSDAGNLPTYQYQYQYRAPVTDEKEELSRQTEVKTQDEIQKLINLQSQIPYHVIANKIVYKPKGLFIPKPLPDEEEPAPGTYRYRSQVYLYKPTESDIKEREKDGLYRRV